jgi:hypothetical protein
MLEPYARSLMLDLLRPPEEYSLDVGIGTTYTLDLISLLIAPFAFASFDARQPDDGPQADSLGVLNGLHQYADRLTVFCQVGGIVIPRARYPQLAYLERAVVPCRSPRGGAFHPKVWVLRFVRSPDEVMYRLLCLTRNLTFDRSWDTALTLEGPLLERKNAIAANHPLGDFVNAMPTMAWDPPSQQVLDRIARIQDEVRRVEFALPEGVTDYRFWPIGIDDRSRWPFGHTGRRMLVISPFITRGRLERLAKGRSENLLVSTEPALAAIGGPPEAFAHTYFLSENAKPEAEADSDLDSSGDERDVAPTDLHAKCYIADAGAAAHIWTGSANATDAAFEKNVEFLVELIGSKQALGIDSLMVRQKDSTRLIDLLQEVQQPFDVKLVDEVEQELKALVDEARKALLDARLTAHVHPAEHEGRFDVELRPSVTPAELVAGVSVTVWPVTLPQTAHQQPVGLGTAVAASFSALSLEALTIFYAFEVKASRGIHVRREGFVLSLPTQGLPADRNERLLRLLISDRTRFVQFLLLLLGDSAGGGPLPGPGPFPPHGPGPDRASGFSGEPLLEPLMRALGTHPERLDQIARLVADLAASPDAAKVLPPNFAEIWAPIFAVRQRMLHGSASPTS